MSNITDDSSVGSYAHFVKCAAVAEQGTRLEILLPRLAMSNGINRRGQVALDVIVRNSLYQCFMSYYHPDFITSSILTDNNRIFILQAEYLISEEFYSLTNKCGIQFPITSLVQLHSIGESTVSLQGSTRNSMDKKLLVKCRVKYALVDITTRKSVALAHQFREKLSSYSQLSDTFARIIVPSPPKGSFQCEFLMRYSDTDELLHVNNLVYVNLCLDCATMASMEGGYFLGFTGDICSRLVKTLRCSYMLECRAGEVINAIVWEDVQLSNSLHYLFTKAGKNIFYGFMEFYPSISTVSKL